MSLDNRPRERLEQQGVAALSSAELLAIILKSGTKRENVIDMANRILAKYSLDQLPLCSLPELMQEHGIGKAKACQLLAVFELGKRLPTRFLETSPIESSKDIALRYLPKMKDASQEQCIAIYLNAKNKVIGQRMVTIGILNASLIHPREIFHGAIKSLAHSLIVLHNHPSGDPSPSDEDVEVTKRLQKTGDIMGIPLLDHIILGNNCWWSWREKTSSIV